MNRRTDVWILAEARHGALLRVSFELITRALALTSGGGNIGALVIGGKLPTPELEKLIAAGADHVVAVEGDELAQYRTETYAEALIQSVAKLRPEILLAGATSSGRSVLPYAAMRLHTGLTADCTELAIDPESGLLLQTRPAIGGNIMATIQCANHRPQMATVRPHSTPAAPPQAGRTGRIERLAFRTGRALRTEYLSFEADAEEHGIQDAERLVVVGRGIKKAENLALVRKFASQIGAAVGGTREVVDRGLLSYPHQIGLSGKTVTPKLYIGFGVSGAIQHLAGMQTSGTIVAVNKDPDAQIFKVADFGIVGELMEVLPTMIAEVENGGASWLK